MTLLLLLLSIKIIVTLGFVSAPFLFFSKQKIDGILGISGNSLGLYRVYGMAVTALLVGYAGGIYQHLNGVFPLEIILMGIASNAGATLMMLSTGMAKDNKLLAVFFGTIAVLLIGCLLFPAAVTAQF